MDNAFGEKTGVFLFFKVDPDEHAGRIDIPCNLVLNLLKEHRLSASADAREHLDHIKTDERPDFFDVPASNKHNFSF